MYTDRRSSDLVLVELRLQFPGVLEMRLEGRAHLDEQRFELGIPGARDQRLVQHLDDCLVVLDLVIDVRLVEGMTLELLQGGEVVITLLLELPARGAELGHDVQLRHELGRDLLTALWSVIICSANCWT